MEITPQIANNAIKVSTDLASAALKQLEPGQLLDAIVKSSLSEQLVKIQIANTQLIASTTAKLVEGQLLKLEVLKTEPMLELKIIRPSLPESAQQQILRLSLPKQLPLQQLINQLPGLLQVKTNGLSSATQLTLEHILSQSISSDKLNASALLKAFQNSGILAEANAAKGNTPSAQDLKLNILKALADINNPSSQTATSSLTKSGAENLISNLMNTIKLATQQQKSLIHTKDTATNEALNSMQASQAGKQENVFMQILRLLEGSLARTQLHQLSSLPGDDNLRQIWQFEIPLRFIDDYDSVLVRFEKEEKDTEEQEIHWRVTLEFNFEETGKIQARLLIIGEQVSTIFWCEKEQTHQTVSSQLPTLESMFENAGLLIGKLNAYHGQAPEEISVLPIIDENLFYEKA